MLNVTNVSGHFGTEMYKEHVNYVLMLSIHNLDQNHVFFSRKPTNKYVAFQSTRHIILIISDIEQPLAERMTQPTDGSIQPIQVTEQEKKAVAENDRMCSLLSTILYNTNLP